MRSGLQCSFVSIACHGQRAGLPVISQPTLVNLAMHDYYLRLYWKPIIISRLQIFSIGTEGGKEEEIKLRSFSVSNIIKSMGSLALMF